jgi:hypothetical protein
MINNKVRAGTLAIFASCVVFMAMPAIAQTAQEGKNLSALAPANLQESRPKAPDDLTGTYTFGFGPENGSNPMSAYLFFTPGPKLTPAAQAQFDKYKDWATKGRDYRDDPGACWPLGVPRIMTRYWPLQIIELPTMTMIVSMFENNVRWIYTDGRKHPSDDDIVPSYNGHSIGHWEGKTLVVDTIGLTDDHHWIQEGIPAGQKLHVVERISKTPKGFQDEFSMTDPDNWVGEWKSTKQYLRDDHADIEEHKCIYEEVSKLPSFKGNIRE